MTPIPFNAITKSLPINANATATVAAPLPNIGNSLRVVNEGPNIAFIALSSAATGSLATLPNATPNILSIPIIVGDTSLTIPNDQIYSVSTICRATQTAVLTLQVGEGQ